MKTWSKSLELTSLELIQQTKSLQDLDINQGEETAQSWQEQYVLDISS